MSQDWTARTLSTEEKKRKYQFLQPNHILMIDEALASLGEFGQLQLVVEKGRLRFLVAQRSYDVLKWVPGTLAKKSSLNLNNS